MLIVVLLDGCGKEAGDSDAITAHLDMSLPSLSVEIGGTHRLAVFFTQVKDLSYLNSPVTFQHPTLTPGARVAWVGHSEIGKG